MPRVLLLRHGTATSEEEDSERPLSTQGAAEAAATAKAVANYVAAAPPDLIIVHSGKTRAAMTAAALGEVLRGCTLRGHAADAEALSPNAEPSVALGLMDELRTAPNTLLALVGHLPHLHRVAQALLVDEPERAREEHFTPAGGLMLEMRDGKWALAAVVDAETEWWRGN